MAEKGWLIRRTEAENQPTDQERFRTCGCDQGFPIALDLRAEKNMGKE